MDYQEIILYHLMCCDLSSSVWTVVIFHSVSMLRDYINIWKWVNSVWLFT